MKRFLRLPTVIVLGALFVKYTTFIGTWVDNPKTFKAVHLPIYPIVTNHIVCEKKCTCGQSNSVNNRKIKKRFDLLIKQNLSSLDKKFETLHKSLEKHSEHIFKFLEFDYVPYENNASERCCRVLKVKQKVSGMFKSENGAKAFCQLYSIVDTERKHKQDSFLALIAVAQNIAK